MILGRPIDMSNLDEAYDEVLDVKDGQLGASFEPYFEAIDACIGFAKITFKRGRSFQSEDFVDRVWEYVVYVSSFTTAPCPFPAAHHSGVRP
jgi:hypothetical protein